MNVDVTASDTMVRHFRQILLWPLQLMPIQESAQIQKHWEVLESAGPTNPWRELSSEFTGDEAIFQRRHYNEFVTFLPHVQRFLYGDGLARGKGGWHSESPVRVFRRRDIARAKATFRRDRPPVTFEVGHVELYFFYDIDVVLLAVEFFTDNVSLEDVQHTLYRFGRAYPLDWDTDGTGSHCVDKLEWLSADQQVLSSSDFEIEEKYLAFVSQYRSPYIASHWEFLLKPLALHYSGEPGLIRYRQIEFHRMPLMAYIALDDPRFSRPHFVGGGPPPGTFTDDTQMSIAVAEALLEAGEADVDELMNAMARRFIVWSRSEENNRAPGNACMAGCRNLEAGTPWRLAGVPDSKGCGSAMRVAPIGLYYDDLDKIAEIARASSLLTHGHDAAQEAAAAAALLVALAARGIAPETMHAEIEARCAPRSSDFARTWRKLPGLVALPPEEVLIRGVLGEAWVGEEAVASAMYCFWRHAGDFR
nr:ADP-ribosylglycohydrolase family protein [Burkholderiales bacterium]